MRQRQVDRSRPVKTSRLIERESPAANESRREIRATAWPGVLRRSSERFCSIAPPRRKRPDGAAPIAAALPRSGSGVLQTFREPFVESRKYSDTSFRESRPQSSGSGRSAELFAPKDRELSAPAKPTAWKRSRPVRSERRPRAHLVR